MAPKRSPPRNTSPRSTTTKSTPLRKGERARAPPKTARSGTSARRGKPHGDAATRGPNPAKGKVPSAVWVRSPPSESLWDSSRSYAAREAWLRVATRRPLVSDFLLGEHAGFLLNAWYTVYPPCSLQHMCSQCWRSISDVPALNFCVV